MESVGHELSGSLCQCIFYPQFPFYTHTKQFILFSGL